jgi:hypothetical protein
MRRVSFTQQPCLSLPCRSGSQFICPSGRARASEPPNKFFSRQTPRRHHTRRFGDLGADSLRMVSRQMFLRLHRVGSTTYHEVLETYRDPETRRPKHRLIARWPAGRGIDNVESAWRYARQEQRRAQAELQQAEQAGQGVERARRREARATHLLDGLVKARAGLVAARRATVWIALIFPALDTAVLDLAWAGSVL